ncbi:MAG: hypothetical protein WC756_00040 [Taibaiella sp.]|jgi:hypothetical protein
MKRENKKFDDQLVYKIMGGIKKAVSKLVEETAARNGTLVIEQNGKVVHVPAKELLEKK